MPARRPALILAASAFFMAAAAQAADAPAKPAESSKSKLPDALQIKGDDPERLKPEETLLAKYPALGKYFPAPADNHLRFGFGVAPVELLRNSTAVEASFFQLHFQRGWFDWEMINIAFHLSFSSERNSEMRSFTFRSAPKIQIWSGVSIGPMAGLEFVSFPAVLRQLRNTQTTFQTQHYEPFSAVGPVLGAELTETFRWGAFDVRLSQLAYKQSYRAEGTKGDWYYVFKDNDLNVDQTPLAPGIVFLFEFSLLY